MRRLIAGSEDRGAWRRAGHHPGASGTVIVDDRRPGAVESMVVDAIAVAAENDIVEDRGPVAVVGRREYRDESRGKAQEDFILLAGLVM